MMILIHLNMKQYTLGYLLEVRRLLLTGTGVKSSKCFNLVVLMQLMNITNAIKPNMFVTA